MTDLLDAPAPTAPVAAPAGSGRPARPPGHDVVDAAFVAALTVLGLLGFRQAYGGTRYLVAGVTGLLAGLVAAHLTHRSRRNALGTGAAAVLAAVLLSGTVLPHTAIAGVLPSPATLRHLAEAVVTGWKQLLTTVQPVGRSGDLLALPYVLGIVSGATGLALARGTRRAAAPLAAPVAVGAVTVLLGGPRPAAAVLQGAAFTAVALAWVVVRHGRSRTGTTRRAGVRSAAAGAMLLVSASAAAVAGPHLPFTARPRVVLHAEAPLELGTHASPLAGFRRYTKAAGAESLAARTLFTVRGAAGGRIRIATLDDYDGLVWGASNRPAAGTHIGGFARVGDDLPGGATGAASDAEIAIGDGYSGIWVPLADRTRRVTFGGPRAQRLRESFRYNIETGTGVVTTGLAAGDVVAVRSYAAPHLTRAQLQAAEPHGTPALDPAAFEVAVATAVKLSGSAPTPLRRVVAIAAALRDGAYSDGLDDVPSDPGHGAGRIATFLAGKQFVGNDEQYGAAMALMANAVGVPARVVLTATPGAGGVVKGADVTVDVELSLAGHGWVPLGRDTFTPPRDRKPEKQPKPALPRVPPRVVPPPIRRLPADLTTTTDAAPPSVPGDEPGAAGRVLALLVTVVAFASPPAALIGVPVGSVLGLKATRRRRRRARGTPSERIAAGWLEVLDRVRDTGAAVTGSGTRREQAALLAPFGLSGLARDADAYVFGPAEATDADAERYWQGVQDARRAVLTGLGRFARFRAAVSLRSLVPALAAQPPGEPRTEGNGAA